MAFVSTTTAPREHRFGKAVHDFFAALGRSFIAYMERSSRLVEIDRLNAMSDEELAKIGVRRDRIAYHVFRDCFCY
jgi:uncharacterized protein YjiS (DUF1127 family)